MNRIADFFAKLFTLISIYYIKLVYKTSTIVSTGAYELLAADNKEKFVVVFWHGNSYSLYPYLANHNLYVITTMNARGAYIDLICNHFGYKTIRVPDESEGGNFLFKIRREINGKEKANLTITLDGPLGPYHEPKAFPLVTALLTKRRVLPVSINCKRKLQLTNRWDNFVIPLPFNKIEVHFHNPLEVTKDEMKDDFTVIREILKSI